MWLGTAVLEIGNLFYIFTRVLAHYVSQGREGSGGDDDDDDLVIMMIIIIICSSNSVKL